LTAVRDDGCVEAAGLRVLGDQLEVGGDELVLLASDELAFAGAGEHLAIVVSELPGT
jgi:hypothetical protein